jgi:predicted dehydrogenase
MTLSCSIDVLGMNGVAQVMDIVGPGGLLHYPAEDPTFADEYMIFTAAAAADSGSGSGTGTGQEGAEEYAETERFSVRNDHGDGFVRELKHFHECVRGRLCVAGDGLAVLAIIDAAHRSAESGVPEAVELAPHL